MPSPHLLSAIERYLIALMQQRGVPGFALAITDRQRTLSIQAYGYANLEAKTPLRTDHLFQIGSVSKSSVALLVLQEVEAGRLELNAPVQEYLPFFQTACGKPITLHQLLSHSAGISRGLTAVPFTSYAEVLHLAKAPCWEPGQRFYYSNLGYVTLGWVLERVTGQSLPELRRNRILAPLGMHASSAQIGQRERARFPTAYLEFYGDRPHHPSYGLTPAAFYPFIHGDGSMCATPGDLAIYARLLLNRGSYLAADGSWRRLISEASFERMTTPHATINSERYEGYGIEYYRLGGAQCLEHNGETHGFSTELIVDMDAGLGLVLFSNATAALELTHVAEALLGLLQADERGEPLTEPPVCDLARIPNATDYAGQYHGPEVLELQVEGEALWLIWRNQRIRLEYCADYRGQPCDSFCLTNLQWNRSACHFLRDDAGQVTELIHGPNWYVNHRYRGSRRFDVPEAWHSYVGEYHAFSPWSPALRVHLIKGGLWLESYAPASFGCGPLTPLADGSFQLDGQPETIAFDMPLEGRTLRATVSGYLELYRSEMCTDEL
jgi:CubicO group peptidase (beta-lactamase class C family)